LTKGEKKCKMNLFILHIVLLHKGVGRTGRERWSLKKVQEVRLFDLASVKNQGAWTTKNSDRSINLEKYFYFLGKTLTTRVKS
jgi:hypothetical protein